MERDEVLYYLDNMDEEMKYTPCASRCHEAIMISKDAVKKVLSKLADDGTVIPIDSAVIPIEEEKEYYSIEVYCMDGSSESFTYVEYDSDDKALTIFYDGKVRSYPLQNIKWYEIEKWH